MGKATTARPDNVDRDGFRPNVCMVIHNDLGQVLWARRVGGFDAWQFPQGGVHPGERLEDAVFRELLEEVGLPREAVEIRASSRRWLRYRLPPAFRRRNSVGFVGQKQRWFLLRLTSDDDAVRLDCADEPEFDHWRWVSYWYPVGEVIDFKRDVYRRGLKELAPAMRLATTSPRQAA